MTDLFISKFPKCKLVILNVFTRKDKNEIDKRVEKLNVRLSKFYSKNKIDTIDYKNLDVT